VARSVSQQLASARAGVSDVCQILLSPSPAALDRCAPLLETAVSAVSACLPHLRSSKGTQDEVDEAQRLRLAVRHAKRLLEGAAEFHQNWIRRWGALSGGYTGRGEPADLELGSRMQIEG
jgi:hypothetical protein